MLCCCQIPELTIAENFLHFSPISLSQISLFLLNLIFISLLTPPPKELSTCTISNCSSPSESPVCLQNPSHSRNGLIKASSDPGVPNLIVILFTSCLLLSSIQAAYFSDDYSPLLTSGTLNILISFLLPFPVPLYFSTFSPSNSKIQSSSNIS